ncbi:DEAD/DEAH box helicase [Methanococcus maripaludis]|uniref:DEAD/DEAH box helicase domain-containing protein n=1 Tax=Methanococcus maripaludis TaxID=39152 RepID=A0A7J9PMS2_METMI|nr:DEAD/DEAH box helicase [Methanococcus maripaludis]MBA2864391.1 DEAD/DEAH box helicase domain-containing protein [Methanococcus maripaludis]
MGRALELLNKMRKNKSFDDYIEHVREIPEKDAEYSEEELNLPECIQNYLNDKYIKPYTHQYETLIHARNGKNVLITTSTASGKSLCFNLPVFEKLANDSSATALYIYPTKALSNDQLTTLKSMDYEMGLKIYPDRYDGDTNQDLKAEIKATSRLVVTNPYMLHWVLPHHKGWTRFFENLKYVIIDEAHMYRGVFGSHVSFLIRRLRRICENYGSNPQFVMSTATLANPEEFSQKLTGLDFEIVENDGSQKSKKYFVLYNTMKQENSEESWNKAAVRLFKASMLSKLQTIGFTRTRRMTELLTVWVKEDLDPTLQNKVSAYRSGYSTKNRIEIENRLKRGELWGIFSTNALEVGIDIGSLDSVLMYGYPGTLMSLWQQAGRAGRSGSDSIVTLFANSDALDQYLVKHPEMIFEKTPENAVVDLNNYHILEKQLECAAYELELTPNGKDSDFFNGIEKRILRMEENGRLKKQNEGYVSTTKNPALKVNMNVVSSEIFKVIDENGRKIEEIDKWHVYCEAHKGAILINQGEKYLIKDIDLENKKCIAKKVKYDYHTDAYATTDIKIEKELNSRNYGEFTFHFGEVNVITNYFEFAEKKYGTVLTRKPLDLPPLTFKTTAMWITFPPRFMKSVTEGDKSDIGGLHGAEHAMINIFPLHVMCDRSDIGGVSDLKHQDTKRPTIFIYDGMEGGIGLSEKAFTLPKKIVKTAYELVRDCGCESGCPACIYSPKCGNSNQELDKVSTLRILEGLNKKLEFELDWWLDEK